MNNDETELLQTILDKIEQQWTPEAIRLAEQITFWNCVQNILTGVLLLIAAITLLAFARSLVRRERAAQLEEGWSRNRPFKFNWKFNEWHGVHRYAFMPSVILSVSPLILALVKLLNIWNWIGLFDPRLRLAYDVFTKLMN